MSAIDDLIADLQAGKYSESDQNLIAKVATMVAALQQIEGGLIPSGPEAANAFFAGPASGSPAAPAFRAIVAADIAAAAASGSLAALLLTAAGQFGWNGRAQATSPADGNITLWNSALSAKANLLLRQLQPDSVAGLLATTTNDNAAAGSWGEFLSVTANPVNLPTSGTAVTDLCSQPLTAGDYEAWAVVDFSSSGNPVVNFGRAWVNTVAGTLPVQPCTGIVQQPFQGAVLAFDFTLATGPRRFSLAAAGTVYCSASCSYSVGTVQASAALEIRRAR